jgi:Lamin Tail Domain
MTVVFFNGATDAAYQAFNLAGKTTDANGFFLLGNTAVSPDLGFSNNTLQNGADAVALYSGIFGVGAPVTTTNLIDAVVYDNGQVDDPGLLVLLQAGQPQVNEDQGGFGTTRSIARVPDGGLQRQTSTYVAQAPTPRAFNAPQPYGVLVLQSDSNVEVAEGGATDSYQIALQSFPTANVQVTVDPDSQTDLGAGAGVAIVLTFTPANALIPQTINVTAVDDAAVENNHLSTITHTFVSADTRYNGFALPNVVASITDNDTPAPVSIVVSELMYNPASDETSPGVGEWIEVVNTGAGATDLTGWLFDDEDGTDWGAIPSSTVLGPGQVAVFFDSAFTDAATFRSEWSVPAGALVVGISWGSLGNSPAPGNEVLQLLDSLSVERDVVNYDDASPWPSDLEGHSIYLKSLSADNNAGANWSRSVSGTAKAVTVSGPTFSTSDVGSPGRVFLPGDYDTNGTVGAGDYVVWRKTFGSVTNPQADGSGPTPGTPNGVVDNFDYTFWRANFGNTGAISGAGSGAGAGTLLAGDTYEANPADETQNASPVDAAVDVLDIPFAEATSLSSAPRFSRSTPRFDSLSSVDPLLCVVQRTAESRSFDDTPGVSADSFDTYLTEIDELFASLGNGIDAELEPISILL